MEPKLSYEGTYPVFGAPSQCVTPHLTNNSALQPIKTKANSMIICAHHQMIKVFHL